MLTLLAVILRIVSNPFSNVFQKRLTMEGRDPLMVNFVSYLLLSVVCIVLAISVNWAVLPWQFWAFAAAGGIFGAVGNGCLVQALKGGDLSILGPINSYKSVVGMLVAIIMLGELPSLLGLGGVIVIILGSYFVFDTTPEGFSWSVLRNKAIQYRIYAMVLTAIEAVFIKQVIIYSDATTAFIVWCWFGAFFAFVQLMVMRVEIKREWSGITAQDWLVFFALITCIGTMQFTTNYVCKHMQVGYALALFQLSTLVSIALGYRLFHEQDIAKKSLGSVIMIAGSIMIIFG